MARNNDIDELRKSIQSVVSFDKESLISQTRWGEIDFEPARRDIERIFSVLNYLTTLPLEHLTDGIVHSITNEANSVKNVFDEIKKFTIQTSNPTGERNNLVDRVHNQAENLYTAASLWIPFLAYQRGDVAKNIEQLMAAVKNAESLIENAKSNIKGKQEEIEGIITKAREASASAGAAVFTQDFQKESDANNTRASSWLLATWILGAITLVAAVLMWLFIERGLETNDIWQKLASKLAILALLISATAWCGKIYKALIHQATVNRHRALSLQTFQAFSSAASDAQTKDAVLLQTTKAVFSDFGTGFVDADKGSESDIRVLEVLKTIIPKTGDK